MQMLNEKQENDIKKLYNEYQTEIKPLTFYVERKYHKFPKSLLKEFRDVFDHISRCYEKNVSEEYINENINKAKNHFDRIKLDTYKYVSDYKKRNFSIWKRKYNKYDLQSINDGNFWTTILEKEEEGEKVFAQARDMESKDIAKACELIQKSTIIYDEIEDLIDEKRTYIVKAKFKYIRASFANKGVGFIVGVIASIIGAIIFEYFK